jgi:hypothetical protein
VNGTPTFFINGLRHDGAWADERAFIRALEVAAAERVVHAPGALELALSTFWLAA